MGLSPEPHAFERPSDHQYQFVGVERLGQVVRRALPHGAHGGLDSAEGGHEHDGQLRGVLAELAQKLYAVHARHLQIREHQIGRELLGARQALEAVGGGLDLIPLFFQDLRESGPRVRFVVDDEDSSLAAHGSSGLCASEAQALQDPCPGNIPINAGTPSAVAQNMRFACLLALELRC